MTTRRQSRKPRVASETRVSIRGYQFTLEPAETTTHYDPPYQSGGQVVARPAKRSHDSWLVRTRSGEVVGLLEESTGDEWCVARVQSRAGSEHRLRNALSCDRSWLSLLDRVFTR